MRNVIAVCVLLIMVAGEATVQGADETAAQAQLMAIVKEAGQLMKQDPAAFREKLGGYIGQLEKVELGEGASDQLKMMKLSMLAEFHSLNGTYDASNQYYRQVYAMKPNFGFYSKMVTNLRLKGDEAGARALVDEYRQRLEQELPGEANAQRRQSLVQFVEGALQAPLRKQESPSAGANGKGVQP